MPDNSKRFHVGPCRIPKHPLDIVQTCEHAQLKIPIISRHGSKGGQFIDGMYACSKGLEKITGIFIVEDAGIHSDHDLIISKIDMGIIPYEINKAKEERIDFKRIMGIPVHTF